MFSRAVLISFCLITTVQAQRLVDPAKVPPELREAAEKRRAEQIRLHDCGRKAVTQRNSKSDAAGAYRVHNPMHRCVRGKVESTVPELTPRADIKLNRQVSQWLVSNRMVHLVTYFVMDRLWPLHPDRDDR
jgi:hypothetical protein